MYGPQMLEEAYKMGEYRLKTNSGFLSLPKLSDITTSDGMWYDYADITGTAADPSPVFYCSGDPQVYFHGIANQNSEIGYYINNVHGTSGVTLASYYPKICIMAYLTGTDESPIVNIVLVNGEDETNVLSHIQNHTHENIMYVASWEDAVGTVIEYVDSWDETPSEDENNPFNENAIGGEFADRGYFDETFLQDVLPDPEDMENVDTGGLICCYSLDRSHMYTLNDCLFEADFWQNLANRFSGLSDPLSMILQCVELPLTPPRGSVAVAKIGGISIMTPPEGGSSHSISLPCPRTRYGRYYIGNLINKEVWGSEKDYSATSVSIYLPYVGVKELDVDVVMDNVLELYLYVDYWTGDILYLLRISNSIRPTKYYTQTSVVYRWTGNCAREVPLGRIDNTGPILHAASAIGSAFAGFIGGTSVGSVAASSGLDIEADTTQIQTGAPNVPKNINGFINGFTPTIQTSGNIAGNVGSMDYQYPYLIIKRGVPEYPNGWRGEMGAPRNQMLTISSLSGYTLFSTVYLENIECMAEEKAELERLLTTEGVIL